jgi:hypothetical protein
VKLGRAYRILVRLYPRDYKALFAVEMQTAFERASEEHQLRGIPVFIRFLVGEFVGLLIGAGAEWIAKFTTDSSVRGRFLPDLRMMRPPGVSRELWFAGPYLSTRQVSLPDEVIEAQARISMLIQRMVHGIANHDFPDARRCSYEERQARDQLRRLREQYNIDDSGNDGCSSDISL